MGRIIATAAAAALLFTAALAALEYEPFTAKAVGVRLSVSPGYEAQAGSLAEGATAAAVSLTWLDGPYAGMEVLLARREAAYENVAIWAGLYQRRLGASGSFEAEGERLGGAGLAAAGADDGLKSSLVVAEGQGKRCLEALFLASGEAFYLVQVSYPETAAGRVGAAAQQILSSVEILPRSEEGPPEAGGGRDIEEGRPSE